MLYSLTGVTLTPHGYGMGDIERLWLDSLIHSLYRYKPTSPSPCDNNEKILKQELWQSSGSSLVSLGARRCLIQYVWTKALEVGIESMIEA